MLENELKKAIHAASTQDGRALACTQEWLEDMLEQVQSLQTERRRLSKVEDDYKSLVQIMDRARKLAFLAAEEDEKRPKFKMDANGNLTRLDN